MTDFQRLAEFVVPHPCSIETLGRNMQGLQNYLADKYRNAQWALVTIDESAEEYPFRSADKAANCNVDQYFNGGQPTTLPDGSLSESGSLVAIDIDDRFKFSRDGAKGFVVLDDNQTPPRWRAVYFEQEALFFEADLDLTDPENPELDNIVPIETPPFVQDPSLTSLTDITNEFDIDLTLYEDNRKLIVHRYGDDYWLMPFMYNQTSLSVVTDVKIRYGKLCVTKQTIGVMTKAAATETCTTLKFGDLMENVNLEPVLQRIYIDENDTTHIFGDCTLALTDGTRIPKKKLIPLTTCT